MMTTEKLPMPQIVTPELSVQNGKKVERMHIVWAVAATTMVVVVVTGFVLGFYFFSATTKDIVKHYKFQFDDEGEAVDETIDNDESDSTELYHLHREGGEMQWVLKDFDRGLVVYKVPVYGGGDACYVTQLNTSAELTPQDLNKLMEGDPEKENENETATAVTYTATDEAIRNPSFLGPKGASLCSSSPVYWLFPSCDADMGQDEEDKQVENSDDGPTRGKRGLLWFWKRYNWNYSWRCHYGCWGATCCHLISYVKTYNPYKQCIWFCEQKGGGYTTRIRG